MAIIYGSYGADPWLSGTGGADTIYGFGGDDFIFGHDGRDFIYGGQGNDTLNAGGGREMAAQASTLPSTPITTLLYRPISLQE